MDPLSFYQLADWLIANRQTADGYRAINTCRTTRNAAGGRYDKVKAAVTSEFRLKCLGIH